MSMLQAVGQAALTKVQPPKPLVQTEQAAAPKPTQDAPRQDTYQAGEDAPSAGLYHWGQDENGQKKIIFDEPRLPADDKKDVAEPEAAKAEECTTNTDQVDAEIARLRDKQAQLQKQLAQADDPARQEDVQAKLRQIEQELAAKDNDNYRRQHAQYS